ncbi:acid protease [Xylariaceae sp. FL0804]|nr:acid protease [Xylariaceae sp. FL0804]
MMVTMTRLATLFTSLAAAATVLASPLLAPLPATGPAAIAGRKSSIVASLSVPGVQFRRVGPLQVAAAAAGATGKKKASPTHLQVTRIPPRPAERGGSRRRRSAAAAAAGSLSAVGRFAQVQRDSGGYGYENVTADSAEAAQYAVRVVFNGVPMMVTIDSGSADTWLVSQDFACRDELNNTIAQSDCGFGPLFPGNFSGNPIGDQHFAIHYADGESVEGLMGYMVCSSEWNLQNVTNVDGFLQNVEFSNVTVQGQEMALATQGYWQGNNVTSGVLGLAYPSLTSAYWGNDLDDDSQSDSALYSPLFTRMVSDGLIEAVWGIALDRNSSTGLVGIGGLPPVNVSTGHQASTPILIADINDSGITASQPSFYTIVPTGFRYQQTEVTAEYPFIIDTGTTLTYLPDDIADAMNAQFNPPAAYMPEEGAYFTSCDAIPPQFSVIIDGSDFFFNPVDLLDSQEDPMTGLCQTGVSRGGSGPFVLGLTFLTNVMVVFDVGEGTIQFYSREFY